MKKTIKYLIRSLLIFLVSMISLILIILVLIQTPPVKRKIADIIENQVDSVLNSQLSIGKLDGNFFNHIELQNVWLHSGNDTLASIYKIRLSYSLLELKNNTIKINEFAFEKPYLHLVQLSDSTWNLQHLLKPATEKKDTTSSPFSMSIEVGNFLLNSGNIHINTPDSVLPQQIKNLQIQLSASYNSHKQSLDIKKFSFSTVEPAVILRKLIARIDATDNRIQIRKIDLQTDKNELNINGNYYFDESHESVINVQTAPLALNEFTAFLPENFNLKINPVINLKANLKNKSLTATLSVQHQRQNIQMKLFSKYLIEHFTDSTFNTAPTYNLTADLQHVDLRDWTNDKTMYYILNGNLNITGKGLDFQSLNSRIHVNLNNFTAKGIPVKLLNTDINYESGDVSGKFDLQGNFGSLFITSHIYKVISEQPAYTMNLVTRNLNIEPFMGKDYASDLNLKTSITGFGFNPQKLQAKMQILGDSSQIATFKIDTIHSEVNYTHENISINSLLIKTLASNITAVGNYNPAGNLNLKLAMKLDDAKEITDFLKLDSLNTQLDLTANLSGKPNNLTANMALGLNNTVYKTMLLKSLQANTTANMKGDEISFNANALALNFAAGGFIVDSVKVAAAGDTKKFDIQMVATNPDIQTNLSTMIKLDKIIDVSLSRFGINYKDYNWNLQNDTARITIDGNNYVVSNFVMQSSGPDSIQTIQANGQFSLENNEDFQLHFSNIYLPQIGKLFMPDQKLDGLFSGNLLLNGTAQTPTLTSQFNLQNGAYQDFRISTFEGNFDYKEKMISTNIDLVPFDSGQASLKALLPAEIHFDSSKFEIGNNGLSPVNASIILQKIPLSLINAFFPTDDMNGYLESNISVAGNMNQPLINGNLDLINGKIKVNKYGIDYRKMSAGIKFNNNVVTIDTFNIQSRQGNMFAKGDVRFESDLYEGKMNTASLKIWFDRFNPFDHKQYNMELSGDIDLKADKDSTRFSGNLTIPEAMVFIPAVLNLMGKTVEPELPLPLLAAQLQKDSLLRDSVIYHIRPDSSVALHERELPTLPFLDNLQGKINLKIPRNVWIKNNDMRFELGGDIQLIKHKDFFELFGPVNILRGQYSLLGKVFVIKEGTITFEGGENMDAQLAVEAVYSFRDSERAKHDLYLNVGGSLSVPEISFKYQDEQISEGDALSYILFGTNLESLGSTQQESITSSGINATDIAKTAAASLISSQLTKLLGKTLNMDYIEFKSNSSFDNASFVVGKYITNKLFVSYEQNIGKIEDQDIARYEMSMEYELFKFLFFQLTSSSLSNGFDLIFKFDEK
ncbi:MAG: translocation/assembly module TamB domain-containing protein [Paludibacter sp.]|nr:translocation/assembly module TamB domain-containing protein [Paludibacter sp.]